MAKKERLVSAIVSVYNCERFIAGCLEDLERQTIADKLEIVVVNTGSQQNEDAIIKEFQKKYDNIVYVKTENRETLYKAWNIGIKAASGKYITNANSDDRHRKDAFEIMADLLEKEQDVDFVYADNIVTEFENETFENHTPAKYVKLPEYDRENLFHYSYIGPQPMWHKSLHEKFGYFEDSLKVCGDYEFWIRVSGERNFRHIKEYLGLYFKNPVSLERVDLLRTLSENIIVRNKFLKNKKTYDKKMTAALKKGQSDDMAHAGHAYMKNKQLSLARQSFLSSVFYDCLNFSSLKMFLICLLPSEISENLKQIKRKIVYAHAKS